MVFKQEEVVSTVSSCPICGRQQPVTAPYCLQCGNPMPGLGTGSLPQNTTLQGGRYVILQSVGRGGMGAVYKAADTRLGRKTVAIKEMSDVAITSPQQKLQAVTAFRQEAQMLARLDHPNIPKVTDSFDEGAKHYIAMDFVEGETLEDFLQRRGQPVDEAQAGEWASQLCDVLGYLHRQTPPVIFRDLKPANIMLTPSGQLKLIDFGIARFFKPGQTGDTLILGTPGYAAPEQYGKGQTDARSDVYSLGVLLHQVLTGHDPATTPFALPPVRQLNPQVSPAMAQAIGRAIELQPAQRFPSTDALCQALSNAAPALPPVVSSAGPRRGWVGALIALVVVAAVGLVAGLTMRSRTATPAGVLPAIIAAPPTRPPEPTSTNTSVPDTPTPMLPAALAPGEATASALIAPATALAAAPTPAPEPSDTPQPTATPVPPPSLGLIAYTTGGNGAWQIEVADPSTGETLRQPGLPPNSGVAAWARGGGRLAFRSKDSGTWQIYTIDADGSNLRQMTNDDADNLEASWSPDGARLAFVSRRDANKEIYLMDADGANQRRLTDNPGSDDDPSWSPDGQWLVFESSRGDRLDVHKMRTDGSDVVRLTSEGDLNSTPAWSPDGRTIAFERKSGGAYQIWLMDVTGGAQRQVTFDGANNLRPAWSPDSRQIAFTSDRDGTTAIWVVPVDLSQTPRRISTGEGFDAAWSWP